MGLNKFALLILLFVPLTSSSAQTQPYIIDAETLAKGLRAQVASKGKKPATFYVIDVRSPEERQQMFNNRSIPGTHAWMPADERLMNNPEFWDDYEKRLLEITGGNKKAHIVLYCFFQMHSLPIGMILMERGFPNIYSLDGGASAWYSP
jgi:rhodanese-related sulfurtransferase